MFQIMDGDNFDIQKTGSILFTNTCNADDVAPAFSIKSIDISSKKVTYKHCWALKGLKQEDVGEKNISCENPYSLPGAPNLQLWWQY